MTAALEGLTVVVTRPARQAGPFVAMLRDAGANPILLPAIEIEPIELDAASRAARAPDDFDWTVYTSTNAVEWSPPRTGISACVAETYLKIPARRLRTFPDTA